MTTDPLAAVGGRLGGFFALPLRTTEVSNLRTVVDDPVALDALITSTASALHWSGDEAAGRRVAASTALFGLSARIVSPVLAAAVMHRAVPILTLDALYLRSGSLDLARDPAATTELGEDDDAAALLRRILLAGACADLVVAFAAATRLATHILWGNVSSSLVSAARLLEERTGEAVLPLVHATLSDGPTASSVIWSTSGGRLVARRTDCCLYYLAAPGRLCADCILRHSSPAVSK